MLPYIGTTFDFELDLDEWVEVIVTDYYKGCRGGLEIEPEPEEFVFVTTDSEGKDELVTYNDKLYDALVKELKRLEGE